MWEMSLPVESTVPQEARAEPLRGCARNPKPEKNISKPSTTDSKLRHLQHPPQEGQDRQGRGLKGGPLVAALQLNPRIRICTKEDTK